MRLGINGLGRIGRLVLRVAVEKGVNIAAVNDRNDLAQLLPLIKRDSIYGPFSAGMDGDDLMVAGRNVPVFRNQPFPDWGALGADIVLECSGGNPDGSRAREHLKAGAKAVIISAPAPNVDATLIIGVNEADYDPGKHKVVSMASCTANCLAPVLKQLQGLCGVKCCEVTSVNAYTNAQRIVDAPHADPRRARAAALNIIPTMSSAIPSVKAILGISQITGLAYRVPVACGSVCDITVQPVKGVTAQEVNEALPMPGIVAVSMEPLVSTDVIGNPHSAVVDGLLTYVEGDRVRLVVWYDNEYGFCNRLIDLASYMATHDGYCR